MNTENTEEQVAREEVQTVGPVSPPQERTQKAEPKERAKKFRAANGYSLTRAKLMAKNGCKTQEEYRALHNKRKKEGYVGPARPKKAKPAEEKKDRYNDNRGGNRNYGGNRGGRR